eukprot:gene31225-6375_t
MISRHSNDLGLCRPDSAIDLAGLAFCLHEHSKSKCSMVVEVQRADSLVAARQLDSVMLTRAVFRPKMVLQEEVVHLSVDMSDLTANLKCSVVEARLCPGVLVNGESLAALIPLMQDHDPSFREEMLRCTNLGTDLFPGATIASGQKGPSTGSKARGGIQHKPKHIIVFVTNNSISSQAVAMATSMARAGNDHIHLVTFVASEQHMSDGKALLDGFVKEAMHAMVEVHSDVRRKGVSLLHSMQNFVAQRMSDSKALLDGFLKGSMHTMVEIHYHFCLKVVSLQNVIHSMQNFVAQMKSREETVMVVMGSVLLTIQIGNQAFGSITLSLIRRLPGVPVVVVTANSKRAVADVGKGMRVMAVVEGHSRRVLDVACVDVINQVGLALRSMEWLLASCCTAAYADVLQPSLLFS